MTESDRRALFSAIPILSGFLGTLLEDASLEFIPERRESLNGATDDTIWTCPDSTFNAAADICRRFLAVDGVRDILIDDPESRAPNQAGSDLYLTIAGHGAGFWDGDWEPHGDALTEAARRVAGCDLETYIGDDGHVYICGRE